MDPKRIGWWVGLGAAVVITWFLTRSGSNETPSAIEQALSERPPTTTHAPPTPIQQPPALPPSGRPPMNPIAAKLNDPTLTAEDDVAHVHQILSQMFGVWKSQRPPMSLNAEFTRALTGNNPVRLPFVPADHPAIVEGELVDRWGTPYQFHQLSLDRIEVRSAGPDQQLYTEDDALFSPWTKEPPAPANAENAAGRN